MENIKHPMFSELTWIINVTGLRILLRSGGISLKWTFSAIKMWWRRFKCENSFIFFNLPKKDLKAPVTSSSPVTNLFQRTNENKEQNECKLRTTLWIYFVFGLFLYSLFFLSDDVFFLQWTWDGQSTSWLLPPYAFSIPILTFSFFLRSMDSFGQTIMLDPES